MNSEMHIGPGIRLPPPVIYLAALVTGRALDAQARVDYFQPLYEWLVEQNQGRAHTLPDL